MDRVFTWSFLIPLIKCNNMIKKKKVIKIVWIIISIMVIASMIFFTIGLQFLY